MAIRTKYDQCANKVVTKCTLHWRKVRTSMLYTSNGVRKLLQREITVTG